MRIQAAEEQDWVVLKSVRLAALTDAPTAFGVSHAQAAAYRDEEWQARPAGRAGARFWLAVDGEQALGMVGAALSGTGRYNLIGMWVAPAARGTGLAAALVRTVQAAAVEAGHRSVFLDVAPGNAAASRLYTRQGFAFIDEWEALASHPHIQVQTMQWKSAVA